MKKILIVLLTLTAVMMPRELKSQGQDLERIQSYKIALFTRRLNLTPAEAEKFWPVYNEFDGRRTRLQQQRAETIRMVNQNEKRMSDADLLKAATD